MIAMLLDFKSGVYGLARSYFEFWYWAGHWAGFVTQTWQPWIAHMFMIAQIFPLKRQQAIFDNTRPESKLHNDSIVDSLNYLLS